LSTLRTGVDVKRAVEAHVVPQWGQRPLSDIRRADVNELARELRKGAPIRANRVLAYLKTFFGWAVDQELVEASPAAAVKRPSKEVKRDRVLTDPEIEPSGRHAANSAHLAEPFGSCSPLASADPKSAK
jgi:integrase